MLSIQRCLLLIVVILYSVQAGTWLAFNDVNENRPPMVARLLNECSQRQMGKRLADHRIMTRAEREKAEICRMLEMALPQ